VLVVLRCFSWGIPFGAMSVSDYLCTMVLFERIIFYSRVERIATLLKIIYNYNFRTLRQSDYNKMILQVFFWPLIQEAAAMQIA